MITKHPELVPRTCELCSQWAYDDKEKELGSEIKTIKRTGKRVPRGGVPTPCAICPKNNRVDGRQIDRTIDKAIVVLKRFWQLKATNGASLTKDESNDELVLSCLGLCEQVIRESEADRLSRRIAMYSHHG